MQHNNPKVQMLKNIWLKKNLINSEMDIIIPPTLALEVYWQGGNKIFNRVDASQIVCPIAFHL